MEGHNLVAYGCGAGGAGPQGPMLTTCQAAGRLGAPRDVRGASA
jgi:hypothetical protein